MKKLSFLLYFLCLGSFVGAIRTEEKGSTQANSFVNSFITSLVLGGVSAIKSIHQHPGQVIGQCAAVPACTWLATAGHELGHCFTAKLFRFPVFGIWIGRPPYSEEYNAILSGRKMVYGFGVNPSQGATCWDTHPTKMYRNAMVSAAGPISGVLSCYALAKASNIYREYQKGNSLTDSVQAGIQKPAFAADSSNWIIKMSLLHRACADTFVSLFPTSSGCDGADICQFLKVRPSWQNRLSRVGWFGAISAIPFSFFATITSMASNS